MAEPFFLNLGTVRNQKELDILYKPFKEEFDLAYFCAATIEKRAEHREWIEKLWKNFEPFADKDFLKETRTRAYHQRTWEMYLANIFLDKGFDLIPFKTSEHPDLGIKIENRTLWVEAIAGDRADVPIYKGGYNGPIDVLDDPKVLRITSCLFEKKKKYDSYLEKGIVSPDDICVIAINGSDFDGGLSTERLYMKALYGFHAITYNFETKKSGNTSRHELLKNNGAPVLVAPFMHESYQNISAVFYCGDHISGCPIESIGKNMAIIHNSRPIIPMALGLLKSGIEHYYDTKDKVVKAQIWEG